MKIQEILEGKFKDLAYNLEYDKQHSPAPTPPKPAFKPKPQYYVSINGKHWKDFDNEKIAMNVAKTIYNKNPRLRVDVLPIK